MTAIVKIIEDLGGSVHIARSLTPRLPHTTVSAWKQRDAIPVRYWPELIQMSGRTITAHMLMMAHFKRERSNG